MFELESLNNIQKTLCAKHAGAARYAYNWGLARKQAAYKAGEKTPTAIDLYKELNQLKKGELAWMYAVSKCAPQSALQNLDHFFRRAKAKKTSKLTGKGGYPRFKSKKHGLGSFRLSGAMRVFERHIQLPRMGKLRLKERGYLPITGVKILSATVSEHAGQCDRRDRQRLRRVCKPNASWPGSLKQEPNTDERVYGRQLTSCRLMGVS